jgi:hypothetical protein
MRILRGLARHARHNAIAYVALFVALSGTAYAVARNSIGTKQLKPGAVHPSDIDDRAVRLRHLGFAFGSASSGIPDVTIHQGAEPHLFHGPAVNARGGNVLGFGTLMITNPATDGTRGTAHVTSKLEVNGVIVEDRTLDVAEGESTAITTVGNAGDVNGFQEVDSRVGSVGANIHVDGGDLSAMAAPPPDTDASP